MTVMLAIVGLEGAVAVYFGYLSSTGSPSTSKV